MSLYLGRTLVAGGGARVIICKSRQDYIRQFEARGASGACDFYYVPPIDEQVDLRGVKISLIQDKDEDENVSSNKKKKRVTVQYRRYGINNDLWSGLSYTYDGVIWRGFQESDGDVFNIYLSSDPANPNEDKSEVYIRASGPNKTMYSQDGNFWRRFRFYVDGGLDDDYDKNAGVQIENSYLHLLDPYFGTTSATLSSYKGVPCVFMKAFAADSDNPSPALMYADDIPVPNGDTLSVLSATPSCYMQMFQNCSSLTSSPDIGDPAVYEYDSDLSVMKLISWIGQDAFTSAFAGCPNLSSVNIGFVEWEHENVSAFTDFLKGAALTGQLYGPSALLCAATQASCVSRYIPAGWEISSYESVQDSDDNDEGGDDDEGGEEN